MNRRNFALVALSSIIGVCLNLTNRSKETVGKLGTTRFQYGALPPFDGKVKSCSPQRTMRMEYELNREYPNSPWNKS